MEPGPTERDPFTVARFALLAAAIALNLWLRWDTPEVAIMRRRVSGLWSKWVIGPERRAKDLRRMEGEVVFEAIEVVTDGR